MDTVRGVLETWPIPPQDKEGGGHQPPTPVMRVSIRVSDDMKKTLSDSMTATQVKAMLRKILLSKIGYDYAIYVDDPCVNISVDWDILDKFVDKEFASP